MPITPLDIRKKTFTKVNFRGVDPNEVKNFLEQIARDMESLAKERTLLVERVDELNAKLEGFTRTEKAFQEAFISAQKACDELRENAHKEAETIVERAKFEGEKLVHQAAEQTSKIGQDINDVRARKLALLGELRGIAESLGKMVDHWETEEKPRGKSAKGEGG
jgi:cell division initiation protein